MTMKRFAKGLLYLLLLIVVFYWGGGLLITAAARRALPLLQHALNEQGVPLYDLSFGTIRFTSFNRLTVFDLQGMAEPKNGKEKFETVFAVDRADARLVKIPPAFTFSCDGFSVHAERGSALPGTAFARVDDGYWASGAPVELKRLPRQVKRYLQQLDQLFDEQLLDTDMRLRAQVTLNLRGKEAQVVLYTVQEGENTRLRLETRDVQKAAQVFQLELSPDEVEIISRYPVRAPVIMEITSEARTTARNARRADPAVPEDAYRHVLWSYLLTQKFGPEFAEKVTDAHEVLPTNTPEERRMDFINNRIGRSYALRGVPRERLLALVLSDPQVVRYPQEAAFKN